LGSDRDRRLLYLGSMIASISSSGRSVSILRQSEFRERHAVEFLDTTSFGRITTTRDAPNDPREIRFGLKLYW
jgi:hypothetical protein